jgi:hypothetical protein
MSHFRSKVECRIEASSCQGSCAALLRAEKADALQNLVQPPNLVQPRFLRLDGWNPHVYWVRLTSQPFRQIFSCTCVRARIRVRVCRSFSPLVTSSKTTKQVRKVRRLDEANVYKALRRLTFRPTFRRLGKWQI